MHIFYWLSDLYLFLTSVYHLFSILLHFSFTLLTLSELPLSIALFSYISHFLHTSVGICVCVRVCLWLCRSSREGKLSCSLDVMGRGEIFLHFSHCSWSQGATNVNRTIDVASPQGQALLQTRNTLVFHKAFLHFVTTMKNLLPCSFIRFFFLVPFESMQCF